MIKFRLRYGNGGAKPPFVGVKVEKAKDGRAYRVSAHEGVLRNVADYIVRGLLMGPRTFTITLVAPVLKGEAKAALRAGLPGLVRDLRSKIEGMVKEAIEKITGREVPLFKGQKVYVPGWAITARVLLLPERAQEEFSRWLHYQWLNFLQREEEAKEKQLEVEEAALFLEGPHFGDIEERAERLLYRLLQEDKPEFVGREWGLGAALARARWILGEGIIAPLIRNRGEALKVIEDYQSIRAREIASSTLDFGEIDLGRALYERAYLAEAAIKILNAIGLDWPVRIIGGKLPSAEGVHPLFLILEAARLEAAWGRLMDRLRTQDFDLLRAARRFQRLLDEGLSFDEALEKTGLPVEVALLLTEGPRLAEYLGEDEEPLMDEDDILEQFQEEALEEALAAWGFKTPEEALEALEALGEDPLAQAFRVDVQRRFASKRLAVGI